MRNLAIRLDDGVIETRRGAVIDGFVSAFDIGFRPEPVVLKEVRIELPKRRSVNVPAYMRDRGRLAADWQRVGVDLLAASRKLAD